MSRAATRSRWLELRREEIAARRGRQLLDEKREVLVRELVRARSRCEGERRRAAASLASARAAAAQAEVELGHSGVEAAALAQRMAAAITLLPRTFLGVSLPAVSGRFEAFRARYAPGGTAESLDRAARAYADLLPLLLRLAQEELAVANLSEALARTNRRWNALDRVLIPGLVREIRRVKGALEEEARDEAVRGRRLARARTRDGPSGACSGWSV